VDVIFRMDMSELYAMELDDNYIAATRDLGLNLSKDGVAYIESMPDLHLGEYIQSGFIILNNKAINKDRMVERFKLIAQRKMKYQDQDTLNIACYGKIYYLSLQYNMTDYSFEYAMDNRKLLYSWFDEVEIETAIAIGNLHYNGHKPWKKYCVNFDIWWEYYRKSPFYDPKYHFDFFYKKLDELDQLPLIKRIKILVRYFVYGRK
jgi:lipopolysaccharide biosynthesis glycosyltransferase